MYKPLTIRIDPQLKDAAKSVAKSTPADDISPEFLSQLSQRSLDEINEGLASGRLITLSSAFEG